MGFLPSLAIEFLTELPDQLSLRPAQPTIFDGHREQALFPPTLGLDLLR